MPSLFGEVWFGCCLVSLVSRSALLCSSEVRQTQGFLLAVQAALAAEAALAAQAEAAEAAESFSTGPDMPEIDWDAISSSDFSDSATEPLPRSHSALSDLD